MPRWSDLQVCLNVVQNSYPSNPTSNLIQTVFYIGLKGLFLRCNLAFFWKSKVFKNLIIMWNWLVGYKGTVSVISSEPICKDGSTRFTTTLSDQVLIRYQCFLFFELFIFIYGFSTRSSELRIFCLKAAMEKLSGKWRYLPHFFLSD